MSRQSNNWRCRSAESCRRQRRRDERREEMERGVKTAEEDDYSQEKEYEFGLSFILVSSHAKIKITVWNGCLGRETIKIRSLKG